MYKRHKRWQKMLKQLMKRVTLEILTPGTYVHRISSFYSGFSQTPPFCHYAWKCVHVERASSVKMCTFVYSLWRVQFARERIARVCATCMCSTREFSPRCKLHFAHKQDCIMYENITLVHTLVPPVTANYCENGFFVHYRFIV